MFKVSYYMERRTKEQCYQRYVYSLKDIIKKGPFSDAEDILLFIGEKLYKNDWTKISEMIQCRTPIQLHSRFHHFLKADHKPWTEEEDVALLEQVRKHGLKDWVLVSQQLSAHYGGDRTRGQCRQRFQYIYKCFKRNPALALASISYKEDSGLARRRLNDIHDKISERFEEWKEAEKAAGLYDPSDETRNVSTFGHIRLPNGEVISRKSLTRFIRFIQEFLPTPSPPAAMPALQPRSTRSLPDHEEELFKRPVKAAGNFRNSKPNSRSKLKVAGYNHKKFKTYKNTRKQVMNRDKLQQAAFKTMIDRNISKFFRPTWVMRNRLTERNFAFYNDRDLETLTSAAVSLSRILKVKKLDTGDAGAEVTDRNDQLLRNFSEKQFSVDHQPLDTSASSSTNIKAKAPKTYGRTYGRKSVKQSVSRSATPAAPADDSNNATDQVASNTAIDQADAHVKDEIDLVPPSLATLVGLRGVLLNNKYLKDPNNHCNNVRKERDDVDTTVRKGVSNPDYSSSLDSSDLECQTPSHLAADQLLTSRFLQLFLWPAKMSVIAPTNQEDLFSDDEEEENIVCVDTTSE